MPDGYGHGEEEEDAPRGGGRCAPDEGDRVEEGDSPDEGGGEDAADEEEEEGGDDEFEDEVEEHGDDDNPEADGEREAARDATKDAALEVGGRERLLEWGRRRTIPLSAACTRGAAAAPPARASVPRCTLCSNLTTSALIRSKSSDSFCTSTRQSPDGRRAGFFISAAGAEALID